MKILKKQVTFNLRETTIKKLKKYCKEDGIWNMSTFIDVAILDKLEQENENKKFIDKITKKERI